jgi:esterase
VPTEAQSNEFASLVEVAAELGVDAAEIPSVTRQSVGIGQDQRASVVIWGSDYPELVFLHGGGQNARTWDLVAMDLGRPAIAIDLPGHGHSSWRADKDYGPTSNAEAVAATMQRLAPAAECVVGMSLGGLTAIRLAAEHPELVHTIVLVDVTPSSRQAAQHMTRAQRGAVALISGPRSFASLEQMFHLAVQASPRRSPASVRRGVTHNAVELPDGSWTWRYDSRRSASEASSAEYDALWDDVARLQMPAILVKGADSGFVTPEDLDRLTRLWPALRVEVVLGAGHAVQSDQPKALAALIRNFLR